MTQDGSGLLSITHCTFKNNSASSGGAIFTRVRVPNQWPSTPCEEL